MKKFWRQIIIEEYYKKIGKDIFWFWRFPNEKQWRKEKTPLPQLPYAILNFGKNWGDKTLKK